MILGMHNMLDSMSSYWRTRVSSDGALWILMMDALFLIPRVFAVFFYPKPLLAMIAGVLLVSGVLIEGVHVARTHHLGWRKH